MERCFEKFFINSLLLRTIKELLSFESFLRSLYIQYKNMIMSPSVLPGQMRQGLCDLSQWHSSYHKHNCIWPSNQYRPRIDAHTVVTDSLAPQKCFSMTLCFHFCIFDFLYIWSINYMWSMHMSECIAVCVCMCVHMFLV